MCTGPVLPQEGNPPADDHRTRRGRDRAVVASTALDVLGDAFVLAQPLPDPAGARVLGCTLRLTRSDEAARDWWQYAAGDGDATAAFCLHLHHLARGELTEARWWHAQAERTVTPTPAFKEPAPATPDTAAPDRRPAARLHVSGAHRTRWSSTLVKTVEYVWPRRIAKSSTPSTRGVPNRGSGNAMTLRNKVIRPAPKPSWAASRAPTRR
ncbi:hypothetical protein [Streptomyces sp. NBC_01716]|uniref:hypothetical protein n=1 Tax=Streptomyces sp. NBC_01716 TaxID=2975917 RepID=UPI002E302621|nr:hypothetical protein [Streptomyces sp. NBC_01716]